jgi:alpha-mannosidase
MLNFRGSLFWISSVLLISLTASQAQTAEKPDLTKQPTLYVVGYAHLDTEWRWEYPQVIDEYIRKTMEDNFRLFDKYPHYIFNFSGANRYRFMKEYFPADYTKVRKYVDEGRWFPAGSSMEEGDVNAPSAEGIIRQILYGNEWFRAEFGKASEEYMLPDCFGFPASLPTILAHSGVKGFSTQKLTWGSSANAGGWNSREKTPEGTPFNVGVWVGPDGESVLAGLNPGGYGGDVNADLSKPLPPPPADSAFEDVEKQLQPLQQKLQQAERSRQPLDPQEVQRYFALRSEQQALEQVQRERSESRYQHDWATRVEQNGKVSGVYTDYHYYGTGDIGGTPDEASVRHLEAIVTQGTTDMPPQGAFQGGQCHADWPPVKVGDGPVHVVSATADQMFRDITPAEAAGLPRYTGEMELTNHSAGSLTSQAYQKRWIRKEELLADAAEETSIAAEWLGARPYPRKRLNDAWTLAMGGHFHDIAAGTATPKSYEFAWNDDVIAMNQFAGILSNATEGVSATLDTETKGVPILVFNPLNIAREDVVEADVKFAGGVPKAIHVIGPDGKEVPAQISDGKAVFLAKVPSVGYAVFDIEPGAGTQSESLLHVTENSLENRYYRVKLNADGDVASIFDKSIGRELLAAPARLAISYDNPQQWPAWNMDWEQEQAPPKTYVGGQAHIRVTERGPARITLEVSRETAGSAFVQTIGLSAGDAGKRVEFGNVIDWNTRESNLKATFPLSASNEMATYNWDIGTIERPTAQPKKFEVPSHQWIDLTDMNGEFGATILTDCKNGSDKPNDNTIRLTLIRTPGTRGGYSDQATQDLGHHEFRFGIAGHAGDWRQEQDDWQAQRLNDPLIAFQTSRHAGSQGRQFSLLKVSNSRIRVLALKKAERSDEVIVRLVELNGQPQSDVRVSFASPVIAAREVNGQEEPVGSASVSTSALVASFGAYQPRTFAVKLAPPTGRIPSVRSAPVPLHYDVATASSDATKTASGFDGHGNALPAEMLPSQISFNGVQFDLAPAKTNSPNAVVSRGQTITLPSGRYNRVYLLAASASGDQKATFEVGSIKADVTIENWGGFIGQWDDRRWSSKDTANDNYGEMTGLVPGYIKRADLVWYCSHHHNAVGENVAYAYSYLFAYSIDLPDGTRTIRLPENDKIRILAMSVADEETAVAPVQPLYDVLPPPNSRAGDFLLSVSNSGLSVTQGRSVAANVNVFGRNGFDQPVNFTVTGLPSGVTASFSSDKAGSTVMTVSAANSTRAGTSNVVITGSSGNLSHTATVALSVTEMKRGTVSVDLSSDYNIEGIYTDRSKFSADDGLDGGGFALSEQLLGAVQEWDGVVFHLGPANAPNAVTSKTITLPEGRFARLEFLATGVEGAQESQVFGVTYTDGTSAPATLSLSDWYSPANFEGESVAVSMPYRLTGDGSKDERPFHIYGYSLTLDPNREVQNIALPNNKHVAVLAMTLVPTSTVSPSSALVQGASPKS